MVNASADPSSPRRLVELDGLRGWAALAVVVYHLTWWTYGEVLPGWRNPITAAFNGRLAVDLFFVLSGEALSSGHFAGRGYDQAARLAVTRLPRLVIPILASMLALYGAAVLGLTASTAEAARLVRSEWLAGMHPEAMSLVQAVKFAVLDVFTTTIPNGQRNPFLWTMAVEMLGSLLVFVAIACWPHLKRPGAVVAGLGLLLLANGVTAHLADFLFGMVISHWRHRGVLGRTGHRPWMGVAAVPAMAVLLAIEAWAVLKWQEERISPLIAPALVAVMSFSRPCVRFLSNAFSQLLGRLSFPLYLVQYPVIVSLTTWLIARNGSPTSGYAMLVVSGSLLACVTAAWVFEPIETLTKNVNRWIGSNVLQPRSMATADRCGPGRSSRQ